MRVDTSRTVDVRDMLCAQALAIVSRVLQQPPRGQGLEIVYTTEDVKRDLVIWAQDRGYEILEVSPGLLRLMQGERGE